MTDELEMIPALRLEIGDYALDLSWIGEGWSGDYNPDDEDDQPLLRFDAWHRPGPFDGWVEIDDSSYCTRLDARTDVGILIPIMGGMLRTIIQGDAAGTVKRTCEALSWVDTSEPNVAFGAATA